MKKSLLVIFGLPGTGKSYAGELLQNIFGYFVYDGDSDIPQEMKHALVHKEVITDSMRREYIANMISSVKKITDKHHKLVIQQTFLKEFMRKQFLEAFPEVKFILVESPDTIREKRYSERKYFNLGIPYLRHTSSLFEPPHIPHVTIYNKEDGIEALKKQLQNITQGNL